MAVEGDQIVVGCDAQLRLTLTDVDGNPVSLTGNRVRFALRKSTDEEDPIIILKDSDVGVDEVEILPVPDDNQALIKITPTDTLDPAHNILVEQGVYVCSVKVNFAGSGLEFVVYNETISIVDSAFNP
jgi:hypothetical protein